MLSEFDIIARYFARPARRKDVVLGVGDDAALVKVPAGQRLVVAVDTIVAGVHYPAQTTAADIGYRALAVNLSDLAAMGADPAWATLSLSIPQADAAWLEEFACGFYELAAAHDLDLIGGDTVKGPEVITVQVLGLVDGERALRRSGAKPGDCVLVSGVPGEAAAGLEVVRNPSSAGLGAEFKSATHGETEAHRAATALAQRFFRPTPRVALGRRLRGQATAAMDISDGLLTDLGKLCAASECGADLDLGALPASSSMSRLFDASRCERFALAGGDDYELLFTAPEERARAIMAAEFDQTPCTIIGRISAQPGVRCGRDGKSVPMAAPGYDHFVTE